MSDAEVYNSSDNEDTTYYRIDEWDPFEYFNVHKNWIFYSVSIGCAIAVFGGVFTSILAFVVLARSRLWLRHEGYIYLAANFCTNVGILVFCTSSFWMTSAFGTGHYSYYPPHTSTFMCKVWHFLMSIFFASGWLSVALLFNVYLREHLIHRRRCGCPMFAAKYCTLFASKIIVGVIFSVLFVFGIPYLVIFEIHEYDNSYSYRERAVCHASRYVALRVAMLVESIVMWALPFILFLPIILIITLCTKREGNTFGFSQIEERSASDEQMRVIAVTLSSMTLFSQFVLVFVYRSGILHSFYYNLAAEVTIELVFALSISIQPILCFIILKALREEFRSQLRRIRCCRRLFPSLDRDEEAVLLSAIQEDPPSPAEP